MVPTASQPAAAVAAADTNSLSPSQLDQPTHEPIRPTGQNLKATHK